MAVHEASPADPTTDKPPRRKRWIPVSVRILATIFVMLTFGILLPTVVRQYRQSVAREALEDRSASIETEYLAPHWLQDCVEEFLGETAAGMLTDVVEVDLMDADEPDLK